MFLLPPVGGQVTPYTISTIAGTGTAGYSGDGGSATSAEISLPIGVVADPTGNVYFSDMKNNRIRMISASGTITTIAGTGKAAYNGDNIPATTAQLSEPYFLALDSVGNLYIADTSNYRVRKVAPNGIITTVAGNGTSGYLGDGGSATSAELNLPGGVAVDRAGNIYITDSANEVIREVTTDGVIHTIGGNGKKGYSGNGGPATSAELNLPLGIVVDLAGNVYFSEENNGTVRKIDTNGNISVVAGVGKQGYAGDGGPATGAYLNGPTGLALDPAGDLFIGDAGNNLVRAVLTNGTIEAVAGVYPELGTYDGDGGPATSAELNGPYGVSVGPAGDVYIADNGNDRIRQLAPSAMTIGYLGNAFGGSPIYAGNAWVIVRGNGLSPAGDSRIWQASDFTANQMPTSLDGVSATINGVNAYVYYISPSQMNILAPPNLPSGVVQVQVSNNGTTSAMANVTVQTVSPSFFVFDGVSYVIGEHLNGSLIGPASLYPGSTTPVQPGETVVLYANGFGATSTPVVPGAETQSGSLPTLPVVTIGGINATVQFAGLISPGLFQFNVVVPPNAPSGDNVITATYSGASVQPGVLITVQ